MEGDLLTTHISAHVPEKITLYLDFIDMIARILYNPKSKKDIEKRSLKMMNIGLGIMVLAPDPVTKAFIFWKAISASNDDPEAVISAFGDIIMEMRKDLIGETSCEPDDAIGLFLRDQI
jgi:hypothetical protein